MLKKLNRNNIPITSYTIQYEDRSNNTIIRADNNHPYPHIDLQLPDGNKEKRVFDTDPSDYEASVNTVLRYAEFYNSRTIGIDYWLFNVTAFKRELIHPFFNTTRGYFKSSTAYTDIARLVAVEMLTAKEEVNYSNEKILGIIVNKFRRCKIYEEQYKRPLKISKNLIQTDVHVNLFPFPIFITDTVPFESRILDYNGNELPAIGGFFPLGKTTFLSD